MEGRGAEGGGGGGGRAEGSHRSRRDTAGFSSPPACVWPADTQSFFPP